MMNIHLKYHHQKRTKATLKTRELFCSTFADQICGITGYLFTTAACPAPCISGQAIAILKFYITQIQKRLFHSDTKLRCSTAFRKFVPPPMLSGA
jgi:hypothetical protein